MRSEVRILSGAMFLKIFSTGPAETNSIVLGCPETLEAGVFDVPFESAPLIVEAIERDRLKLKMILLTHSHWDHIADAAALKKILDAPLYVHEADAENVIRPGSDGLPLFFPIEGVQPNGYLTEGQTVKIGKFTVQVIHTPGHTPGGVCFWLPKENLLISGDTVFKGTIGNLSFPTARPLLMWESLKKLSKLPPETVVIPGHGPQTILGEEVKQKFGGFLDV